MAPAAVDEKYREANSAPAGLWSIRFNVSSVAMPLTDAGRSALHVQSFRLWLQRRVNPALLLASAALFRKCASFG